MSPILPIGTVVYLKEGSQKLMILNRGCSLKHEGKQVFFDYSASLYPMGMIPDKLFYFNQDDIDKVVFEGYRDEEEERFIELYQQWLNDNKHLLTRGKTH